MHISTQQSRGIFSKIIASILFIIGIIMVIDGIVALINATPYAYLIEGLLIIITSLYVWMRQTPGIVLYKIALLIIFIWAVIVSQMHFLLLLPRIDLVVLIGILLFICSFKKGFLRPPPTAITLCMFGGVALTGISLLIISFLYDYGFHTSLFINQIMEKTSDTLLITKQNWQALYHHIIF